MFTHMEYLQKCFYKSTNWNEDNLFSSITATSHALLDFLIPNGIKLDISSQATNHLASSMTLLNYNSINGSLAYLYSSVPLRNTMGTKDVSLQDAIAGFRIIEPYFPQPKPDTHVPTERASLMYGRMYFPGSALEAMVIKKVSDHTQLLIKCINNPHVDKSGTMIVYLQKNAPKLAQEYIYSTNEALLGFRCLYNLGNGKAAAPLIPKFDNSVVSVGAELWYAANSMSPGLSTALRYSTRSTSTGKPLTMTLACNPILGHISSTYNVKTSVSSTVCSKYDFNWFSYASNLSIGFELCNFSKPTNTIPSHVHHPIHHDTLAPSSDPEILGTYTTRSSVSFPETPRKRIANPIQNLDIYHINPNPSRKFTRQEAQDHTVMTAFQNLVNESNFSSVVKASASLKDRMVKLLWVGRYKDFLVSTGVKMNLNHATNTPEIGKFGITFSYAC